MLRKAAMIVQSGHSSSRVPHTTPLFRLHLYCFQRCSQRSMGLPQLEAGQVKLFSHQCLHIVSCQVTVLLG